MFCSPYPISPEIVKAGLGEICGGFNEFTGEPFPDCEDGLVCESSGLFSIGGSAGNICKDKGAKAGLGETCGGFNEFTGESFPDCEDGLVCESGGFISIPGAGNICVVDDFKITHASDPSECDEF